MINKNNKISKCFVFASEGYEEITYSELCRRQETDTRYKNKNFIFLYGMLMEVTPEQYREFYKDHRRQKYLKEQSVQNKDISVDMLADALKCGDALIDKNVNVEEQAIQKIMLDKLHSSILLLTAEERTLIKALFFQEISERKWSEITGIPQKTLNDRKHRILQKLKKLLEI